MAASGMTAPVIEMDSPGYLVAPTPASSPTTHSGELVNSERKNCAVVGSVRP